MADPVASTSPPTGQKQASPKVKDAPVQKHDSLEVETGAPSKPRETWCPVPLFLPGQLVCRRSRPLITTPGGS